MQYKLNLLLCLSTVALLTGCQDHLSSVLNPTLTVTTLASGLVAPIGVETDGKGRVFVSEQGTGQNDGRVVEVTPDGKVYPVVTGIYSQTNTAGELDAIDHLLYADGMLYFLNPKGLYKVNISATKTGDAPISASSLTPDNIRQFVLGYPFKSSTGESHIYNMTLGPDGAIYITDAGANAIVRRSKTGELSIVAEVPGTQNPNPAGPPPGPPFVESVPTGITYDGHQFLISTLLGYPFPAGKAILYQMNPTSGALSIYQQTFNPLTDVENDSNGKPLVLEIGVFGSMGFTPKTGRLLRANGTDSTVLIDKLNLPTDLKISDNHTAYITSMGDKALLKVTF